MTKVGARAILGLCICLLSGCGIGETGPEAPPPGLEPDPPPIANTKLPEKKKKHPCAAGTALSFQTDAKPVLKEYCSPCHAKELVDSARYGAPPGLDFETHAAAQTWAVRLLAVVSGKSKHPDYGRSLESSEAAKLIAWLNCGAPGP